MGLVKMRILAEKSRNPQNKDRSTKNNTLWSKTVQGRRANSWLQWLRRARGSSSHESGNSGRGRENWSNPWKSFRCLRNPIICTQPARFTRLVPTVNVPYYGCPKIFKNRLQCNWRHQNIKGNTQTFCRFVKILPYFLLWLIIYCDLYFKHL